MWLSYEQVQDSALGLILSPFSTFTFTFTCRHHHDSPAQRALISLSAKKPFKKHPLFNQLGTPAVLPPPLSSALVSDREA